MEPLLLILIISVPVFYIWGFIAFIRTIVGSKKPSPFSSPDRVTYLLTAIQDLKQVLETSPSRTIEKQLEMYKKELLDLQYRPAPVATPTIPVQSENKLPTSAVTTSTKPSMATSFSTDVQSFWSNWYSDNSINVLLYIGAFLIVASASIFVGFAWGTIEGFTKAIMLSLLTIGFFGFGMWFSRMEKIRNAGSTFLGIAALLIPFNGVAWYNFVLLHSGVSLGVVWFVTSFIAMSVYGLLSYYSKSRFYTYIGALGGLSSLLSIVNITQVNTQYYILASIVGAYLLLLLTRLFSPEEKEIKESYVMPLTISANVLMPLSLLFGFYSAITSGTFFSFEVGLAVLLAVGYYGLLYLFNKNIRYLLVSQVLFPISVYVFAKVAGLSIPSALNIIEILPIVYILALYFAALKKKYSEDFFKVSHLLITVFIIFSFLFALPGVFTGNIVIALALGFIHASCSYFITKRSDWITVMAVLFLGIVACTEKWLAVDWQLVFLSLELIGIIYLLLSAYPREILQRERDQLFIISQCVIPIAWLFSVFVSQDNLFVANIVLLTLVTTVFYGLSYIIKRQIGYLLLAQAAGFFTVCLFGLWQNYATLYILYMIEAACLISLGGAYFLQQKKEDQEIVLVMTLFYGFIAFFFAFANTIIGWNLIFMSLLPVAYSIVVIYITKRAAYLYYSFLFFAITLYLFTNDILHAHDYTLLGILYLITAILVYLASIVLGSKKDFLYTLLIGSGCYLLGSFLLEMSTPNLFIYTNIVAVGLTLDASIRWKQYTGIFISNVFVSLTLWTLLRLFHANIAIYPICYMILAYCYYVISYMVPPSIQPYYLRSSLVGIGAEIIIFRILVYPAFYEGDASGAVLHNLELNTLICSYAATVLYSVEAYRKHHRQLAYLASAVGIFTYVWNISFLGINDVQWYSFPLATYFLVMGYIQKLRMNRQTEQVLSYTGLVILLLPTLFQAFSNNGAFYALLLGIYGIVIIGVGLSLAYRIFVYSGSAALFAALLSQTYVYLFSLPRWLITAIVGVLFLSLAIYLLLRRGDTKNKETTEN